MAVIDVTISDLQRIQQQLNQQAAEYEDAVGKVISAVQTLNSQWEGDAQVTFTAEQAKAVAFYRQMSARVRMCGQRFGYAAGRYAQADKDSLEIIRSANT